VPVPGAAGRRALRALVLEEPLGGNFLSQAHRPRPLGIAEEGAQRGRHRLRPVVVEDDAWIGIGAIILKGVRIGAGARIGAGSVVTSDVPAGGVVQGNPAVLRKPAAE